MIKKLKQVDLLNPLLFLFFFTLHADQLGFDLGGYHFRVNNLIALVLGCLFFLRLRTRLLVIDKPLAWALAGMTISVILSFLFSAYKQRCAIFLGWYGWTVICYFLIPYFLMHHRDSKHIFTLYCASFLCVGIYALFQLVFSLAGANDLFAQQRILEHLVRPNAFAYEPSFYALYMTPYIMMCNYHFIVSPEEEFFFPKKLSLWKIVFINVLYLVSTSTSTVFAYIAFFVLAVGMLKETAARKRVFKFMAGGFAFCLALFALAPFLIKKFFFKFFFLGFFTHHSFSQRWAGIKNFWKIFLENYFLGVGLGGCPPYQYDAWLTGNKNYIFFDQLYDFSQGNPLKNFEPTNVLTELFASVGLVGFLAAGFFLWIILLKAKEASNHMPKLYLNLLISLLVTLFVLQFNQGLLRTYVWIHLALVFAFFEKAGALFNERSKYLAIAVGQKVQN